MAAVILKAHFDGERIVLDEPFDLPTNTPLAVTVFATPDFDKDSERLAWGILGAQTLARAYGDDEPEYSVSDLKS